MENKKTQYLIKSISDLDVYPRLHFSERLFANKQFEITSLSENTYNNCDYAIKYDPREDLCFVFNLAYRRELKQMPKSISITSQKFDLEEAINDGCYYKKIKNSENNEKIIIVPSAMLRSVLQDIDIYAQQNEYDCRNTYEDSTDTLEARVRKKESITRLVRDYRFRTKVLKAYNFECAICRCNIPEVLQAAHIIPVKDGGKDEIENGVCLCANHHLMFDNDILKIDFKNHLLYDVDLAAQEMSWYACFKDKYFAKVKERVLCEE